MYSSKTTARAVSGNARNRVIVDALENRRLLSGSTTGSAVAGRLYIDANTNGVFDAGELPGAGLQVFVDYNMNNQREIGEPTTLTAADGTYAFQDVRSGPLALVARSGFRQTFTNPAGGTRYFTLFDCGQDRLSENFGLRTTGPKVQGTLFRDDDADGIRDAAEPFVQGQAVYLDLNNNGVQDANEPGTASGTNGRYLFSDVNTGPLVVRLGASGCYTQVSPAANAPRVINVAEDIDTDGIDFGVQGSELGTENTVRGTIYNDTNENGQRDAGETGQAGLQVFVDYNMNDIQEVDEPTILSGPDGQYEFSNVRSGPLSVVARSGFRQTFSNPAAGRVFFTLFDCGSVRDNLNFGLKTVGVRVTGQVYDDANSNGVRDPSEHGLDGQGVFLDVNNNGAFDINEPTTGTGNGGFYLFSNVKVGNTGVGLLPSGCFSPTTVGYRGFGVTGLNDVTGIDFGAREIA